MKDLTQGPIARHLLGMAAFIGFGMLVQTLYYLVDLYFVAGIGKEAIAGVGGAGNAMFIVIGLTQILGIGTVTLISHAVGRDDRRDATLVFNQSLALAATISGLMLLAGYALAGPYMESIGADAGTTAAGTTYLHWFLPGMALQFALIAMSSALRGTGIVRPTMVVQVLTVALNAALAPVLIAGWGTGRPLGVLGAGLASSIAIAAGVVMLAWYFSRLEKYVRLDLSLVRPQLATWWRMLRIGLPAGGEFALMFTYVAVIYWAIRDFGAGAQAGFGIGSRVMQSLFMPVMAIAFAASPVAGQNFGARHAKRVRETFRIATILSVGSMVLLTLASQLGAERMVGAFSTDPRVIAIGAEYLRLVSLSFVANGVIFACSSLFQGLGNTLPALASSASRLVTFVLPVIWLSVQPWFEIVHVWYLSIATVALQAVASYWLLRRQLDERLRFGASAAGGAPPPGARHGL
ncbi:MAG: MATE family efflux transporter [Gammaproteobacteria bacterium]|nr:MATE family efflux transporter [Gammaproteobacteria bacterium]